MENICTALMACIQAALGISLRLGFSVLLATWQLRARAHSRHTKCLMERQVKQLVKMGALAPRYPGVSEADEQFNDECPICFFRSELFPQELLSTFIRAAATPPSIVATAAEN